MIRLVYELFPPIQEQQVECHLFGEHLENLLPEETAADTGTDNMSAEVRS